MSSKSMRQIKILIQVGAHCVEAFEIAVLLATGQYISSCDLEIMNILKQ